MGRRVKKRSLPPLDAWLAPLCHWTVDHTLCMRCSREFSYVSEECQLLRTFCCTCCNCELALSCSRDFHPRRCPRPRFLQWNIGKVLSATNKSNSRMGEGSLVNSKSLSLSGRWWWSLDLMSRSLSCSTLTGLALNFISSLGYNTFEILSLATHKR